jgi:hypothetical protein
MTGEALDAPRLRMVAAELRATARHISYRPDRESLLAEAARHDAVAAAAEQAACGWPVPAGGGAGRCMAPSKVAGRAAPGPLLMLLRGW